jgi:hypothetical protein
MHCGMPHEAEPHSCDVTGVRLNFADGVCMLVVCAGADAAAADGGRGSHTAGHHRHAGMLACPASHVASIRHSTELCYRWHMRG